MRIVYCAILFEAHSKAVRSTCAVLGSYIDNTTSGNAEWPRLFTNPGYDSIIYGSYQTFTRLQDSALFDKSFLKKP